MAQLYCTGPAHVFIATSIYSQGGPQSTGILYLGTCEDAPDIQLGPEYEPVRNDISGKKKPFDMQYQGEDALISLDLNRYNEAVYAIIANRPLRAGGRGVDTGIDIGALIATEGGQINVYVQFPFNPAKAAMMNAANGPMPPGYRFPFCVPIGPEKLSMGTKPKKVHLLMYAWQAWFPQTQSFLLYDFNMSGLPPIN